MKTATTTNDRATGTVQWLPDDPAGVRWLVIRVTTAAGEVQRTYRIDPIPTGYRMTSYNPNTRTNDEYTVHTNWEAGWTCSCPDSEHRRPGRCKHVCGLRAALARRPYPETV